MKNKILLFALMGIMAGALMTACNKDDGKVEDRDAKGNPIVNNVITAGVENGGDFNGDIDQVKGLINAKETYNSTTGRNEWTGSEIASCSYANGGFTLTLPAEVSAQYVNQKLSDVFGSGKSDTGQVATLHIVAYKSNVEVGYFVFSKTNDTVTDYSGITRLYSYTAHFLYAKEMGYGIYTAGEKARGSFSISQVWLPYKGWNTVYQQNTRTIGEKDTYPYRLIIYSYQEDGLKWYFKDRN
jgi:hypothetical protein